MKKKLMIMLAFALCASLIQPVFAEEANTAEFEVAATEESVETTEETTEEVVEVVVDAEETETAEEVVAETEVIDETVEVTTETEETETDVTTDNGDAIVNEETAVETETVEAVDTLEVLVETYADADVTDDFTDPAFRQFVIDNYGTNGRVMASDLAAVTNFQAHNLGIQNLSGIEHFTSLDSVSLNGNNIGDLSLSIFPRTLKSLMIADANVTSIDTVGGENITTLTINQNPISSIDLAPLTSLICLNMGRMTPNLTSVDFSVAPWIQTVTLMASYVEKIDLSALTNLDGVYISGSLVNELILPESIASEDIFTFLIDKSRLESMNYVPGSADVWQAGNLRPLKGVMIDENGHPYIEIHENSVITNLDELNANGANLVYDPATSRVTWMDSTSAYDFYTEFNKKILFSNQTPNGTGNTPLTGYYDLIRVEQEIFPVYPITPEIDPMVPGNSGYHTINFLDCDGKLVGQAWPQDGESATAPSGYTYDASLITNVTSSRDVRPLNCSGGFVIPNTGSK